MEHLPTVQIQLKAAATVAETLEALHHHFVHEVMVLASWDTSDEAQVRVRRCYMAVDRVREFLAADAPNGGRIRNAARVLYRLNDLFPFRVPANPVLFWSELQHEANVRPVLPAQLCSCWTLPVILPPC